MKKMLLFGMALLCCDLSAKPMHVFSFRNRPVLKGHFIGRAKYIGVIGRKYKKCAGKFKKDKSHFDLLKRKEQ
ncbi:hypothetical protein [Pedobacter steynii]|uniref:Uncharacterized protein n=1 Tax=Pedobacter steynii TaxID=430522 RepID=A0A1D7QB13_9SPHI|nr:hypothetical protein [Pedobacter steynii]AOM75825.1 hypothetical protein BFS30_00745 [Pedobacter steynii]